MHPPDDARQRVLLPSSTAVDLGVGHESAADGYPHLQAHCDAAVEG
jgi:hypothetical protein